MYVYMCMHKFYQLHDKFNNNCIRFLYKHSCTILEDNMLTLNIETIQ